MDQKPSERKRVSKGRYNQYLKRKDPLQHAPQSSKICLSQTTSEINLHDLEIFTFSDTTSVRHQDENHNDQCDEAEEDDISSIIEVDNDKIEEPEYLDTGNDVLYMNNNNLDEFDNDNKEYDELEQEQFVNVDKNENTLFPGSRLTLGAFMVLMMSFVLKYSLTGDGLSDLLNICDLLCPAENLLLKSKVSFKKWFQHIKHPLKVHKYCSFCQLGVNEHDMEMKVCSNEKCQKVLNDSSVSHFIEIPIAEQIKSFFARSSFLQDIKHRFTRKRATDCIEDIYDGEIYRALSQKGGVLENPHNLSLLWNTDGIPCFKSSNLSLWPLFFQINELPYCKRSSTENMILGGLWLGPKKQL